MWWHLACTCVYVQVCDCVWGGDILGRRSNFEALVALRGPPERLLSFSFTPIHREGSPRPPPTQGLWREGSVWMCPGTEAPVSTSTVPRLPPLPPQAQAWQGALLGQWFLWVLAAPRCGLGVPLGEDSTQKRP